jgi:hypothetical protein
MHNGCIEEYKYSVRLTLEGPTRETCTVAIYIFICKRTIERMNPYQSNNVPLLGQGGHTFCNSSDTGGSGGFLIASAIGAKLEANANWNAQRDWAVNTGNHEMLPNGTHHINGLIVIQSDSVRRYENPDTGMHHGIVRETGETYSYTGPTGCAIL